MASSAILKFKLVSLKRRRGGKKLNRQILEFKREHKENCTR